MHTGPELGAALRAAMKLKGVTQAAVAREFGVTQPSVSEWLRYGRVGKQHITTLVTYFADVVGPDHWGLPSNWTTGTAVESAAPAPPVKPPSNFADKKLASDSGWAVLEDLNDMPAAERASLVKLIHEKAENYRAFMHEAVAKMKAAGKIK